MTTKKKTSSYVFVICLVMVPAFAIMLMAFAKKHKSAESEISSLQQIVIAENIPDIAPVDFAKVTRVVPYGEVMDPRTNKMRKHTGIDFQLSAGSEVVATADGVVKIQRFADKYGNYILIEHSDTYSTRYSHLESALVKRGDKITKGQRIGLVGNTGLSSTTPHLHYEILKDGTMVDPKDYLPVLPGK